MLAVEWSDEAQLDFAEILFFIEQRTPLIATTLRETVKSGVELLPLMPFAFRAGRVDGTREFIVHPNYIIVYRVGAETIKILRILHARRQYP